MRPSRNKLALEHSVVVVLYLLSLLNGALACNENTKLNQKRYPARNPGLLCKLHKIENLIVFYLFSVLILVFRCGMKQGSSRPNQTNKLWYLIVLKKGFINILVFELARILKYFQQAGFKYLYASKMSGRKQTYDE